MRSKIGDFWLELSWIELNWVLLLKDLSERKVELEMGNFEGFGGLRGERWCRENKISDGDFEMMSDDYVLWGWAEIGV